jgi:hypothetical protein
VAVDRTLAPATDNQNKFQPRFRRPAIVAAVDRIRRCVDVFVVVLIGRPIAGPSFRYTMYGWALFSLPNLCLYTIICERLELERKPENFERLHEQLRPYIGQNWVLDLMQRFHDRLSKNLLLLLDQWSSCPMMYRKRLHKY